MDIIDAKSCNNNNSNNRRKGSEEQRILFDYKSKQLWPEEASDVDMDYIPVGGAQDSDDSTARDDSHHNSSGDNAMTSDARDQSTASDNGSGAERTVPSIKISKNKRKNSKNWSIVGQQSAKNCHNNGNAKNNGLNVDNNGNDLVPKKRGRKPKLNNGFTVTTDEVNGHKTNKKQKRCINDKKRMEMDYKQNTVEEEVETVENDRKINKMHTKWMLNCLIKKVDTDFEQILPNEILIKIFDYILVDDHNRTQSIINLSQVCESWRKLIIRTPMIWNSLDLQTITDVNLNEFFEMMAANQLFLCMKGLNLSGWNGANAERVLDTVATNCRDNLHELSLKNCKNISSQFLQTLSTHCPNIVVLDISSITATSHQNSQSPFAAPVFRPYLEKCGNNLISLNMSENTMPSFHSCISSIMEFCPNLELLDISNVESFSKSSSISIEKLQTSCPRLRILRAANITFTVSTSGSQTDGFVSLEELSIPFKSDFSTAIIQNAHTDNVLEQLTKNAEHLRLLDIRGARYLSHRALVKIPAWNIQHLSVSNCPKLNTDELEMAFTKWSKSLIDVDISWNTSEESVTSCMKSLCEVGEEESQLRTLQLRGSAISYDSVKCLLKCCPKLESIDLQSCRGLPRGIKRSYSGDDFNTLKREVLEGKYD